MKSIGYVLILTGLAGTAFAGDRAFAVPEIDGTTGIAAITLISGAMLVLRSRRNKK